MKGLHASIVLLLLVCLPGPVSSQEKRMALVIGNSEYQNAGFLMNPVNDAADIGQALRNTGFEVIEYTNLDLIEMKRAIDQFGLKLLGHDVGLFYYAGHGIQSKGINYLVPVDATINTENDVEYNCVDVGRMLAKMEDAGSRTNIVILDACRDNPFERSWSRSTKGNGLAFMNAPTGSLIAYATSPGTTASDGGGENGLYTSAILRHIYEEDISILQMFQKVRRDVREVSGGTQIPWESTSLEGDFYLAGPNTVVPVTTGAVTGAALATNASQGKTMTKSASPDIYQEYFAANKQAVRKDIAKTPVELNPEYFLAQTTRIQVGDSVYFNRFSSSSWYHGIVREVRNNGYYLIQYPGKRGNAKTEIVGKSNVILSRDKHMPAANSEVRANELVYFFTNFDKLITYGMVRSVGKGGVTIQSHYKGSDSHTVPISAVLIPDLR